MEIHSNSPKLYYGFKYNFTLEKVWDTFPFSDIDSPD